MPASGAESFPPRLALDTSAYSHLRRGDVRVIDAVAHAEVVHVPVTVLGELEAGFRRGARYRGVLEEGREANNLVFGCPLGCIRSEAVIIGLARDDHPA